ncbi:MAG: primosomal protein N' family DNA-binding protein [Acidimicrobiales bacterium]
MTARAVRVVTEIGAIDRPFDYALGEQHSLVNIGDRVRVDFHHRSVRGWIVDEAPESNELKSVKKWLGFGPPPSMLDFLRWASERWYGSWSRFLLSASPSRAVYSLPVSPGAGALAETIMPKEIFAPGVIQSSPTFDPLSLVLGAYEATRSREGTLLVLVPSEAWAGRLRGRLEQRGCSVAYGEPEWDRMRAGWPVVVGARGAALAPVPRLAGAVVIDADDGAYRSSAAPTWDALTLVRERCRRDAAPWWASSMMPSPALLNGASYVKGNDLCGGWPRVEVIDRRESDPRDGVLSRVSLDLVHRALDATEPVAATIILQRLGTGRLLACVRCGELARCAQCAQGEAEVGEELSCSEDHDRRARFCRHCGSTSFRRVRVGVTTLARDVATQLGCDVSEVSAATDPLSPLARIVVGTEAVWSRVRRCGVVVFVDFDQYVLAPRASARRDAVTAVGKAGRLVGSRREGRGAVVLQTRRGDDEVIRSLVAADFDELIVGDIETAKQLALYPYGANAQVSGEGASAFVSGLTYQGIEIVRSPTGYELRASDVATLVGALRATPRPPEKFRVAVS